ncbi:integral membrane protein [Fusarium heterosporum]|uniref:Integral membrane protein n=1 Tax=Fusarium heterosporum TaxID=42747 RepID=A0A8H5T9X8_FUSHE|nr:integral membrane protein [Fusarium heterosporum]
MTDDTPNIIAAAAITLPLSTLALAARLFARKITKAGYGIDDAFAVVGWLGSLALLTNGMIWIRDGLGKPMEVGLTDDFTFQDKNRLAWIHMWTTSFTYTFAIAFSKFAILAFYWRLFQFSDIRIPIQILSGITISWFLCRLFMVTLQCLPITVMWNGTQEEKDAKCHIRESTFFFSTVLTHVLIDSAILILPAIEVGKLHLPKGQKFAVIALFAFGAMTCLASIFVLIESFRFKSDSKEMTIQMGLHYAWSIAECNFAVIAACLPMLRPVARRVLPGSFLTSDNGQSTQFSSPLSIPFSNGVRLVGVSKTRTRENDGGSSTHELATGPPDIYDMAEWPRDSQAEMSSPFRKYTSAKDYEADEEKAVSA